MAITAPESLARLNLLKSEAFLTLGAATYDDELKVLLACATMALETAIGRTLEQELHTDEEYSGTGGRKLYLKNWPVWAAGLSVKLDDQTVGATLYRLVDERYLLYLSGSTWETTVTDVYIDEPYLYGWRKGLNNLKVTYTSGYDLSNCWTCPAVEPIPASYVWEVPRDVEYAVAEIAAIAWLKGVGKGRGRLGLTAMTRGVEGQGIVRYIDGFPDMAKAVIQEYRNPNV